MTKKTERLLIEWKCSFVNCQNEWDRIQKRMDFLEKCEAFTKSASAYECLHNIDQPTCPYCQARNVTKRKL